MIYRRHKLHKYRLPLRAVSDAVFNDLIARGLVHDHTDEARLRRLLNEGPAVFYHGIDPTSDSLHVGHLIGVLIMRRLQQAGHRPIALVGGATGMIGDPSGRSDERNLLDEQTLAANVKGIRAQLRKLIAFDGPNAARLVNNHDWTSPITLLEFLRDVGKHVTVNQMVAKDSVRTRMASAHGISFTEFSYMLLQAFDYWWQFREYGCRLQIGGSDQWGNITAGVDLVRRRARATVHGLTWPLMNRADGAKFGKTAKGAVWLDPLRTMPYELHQYFLNTHDRDARRLLLQLTMLSVAQVDETMADHRTAPHQRKAQNLLADEVCTLVHGREATRAARLAATVIFGRDEVTAEGLKAIRGIVPETVISPDLLDSHRTPEPLVEALLACGMGTSKSDARRAIAAGAIRVNGRRAASSDDRLPLTGGQFALMQRGPKRRHLLIVG